jgi:hypothetical protein
MKITVLEECVLQFELLLTELVLKLKRTGRL